MAWTDDPVADWDRHCLEQEKQMEKLPTCANCGEKIMEDYYYEIEGVQVCPDCMDSDYRRSTADYIE